MKREIKKYLYDIKTSIDSINEFLGGTKEYSWLLHANYLYTTPVCTMPLSALSETV